MAARPFEDTQPPGADPAPAGVADGRPPNPEDSMGRRNGAGSDSAFQAMLRDRDRAVPDPGGVDIPL